jgi:hypothetical protein
MSDLRALEFFGTVDVLENNAVVFHEKDRGHDTSEDD